MIICIHIYIISSLSLNNFIILIAQQEYSLLMEDEMIEFVQVLHIPGHDKEKKREESPPAHVKILQTIQETKKSLPIYPFRKDLIQAIKNHQVNK